MQPSDAFLRDLPKAELHLHIEGSLRPDRLLERAAHHGIALPYRSRDDVEQAYSFADLGEFLALYYQGCNVLRDAEDFFLLASDYFERCRAENIVHTEVGFDPQAHLARGVGLDAVMDGLDAAAREARSAGQSVCLIMNFMRDRAPREALEVLTAADPWRVEIDAVGLDSAERGFPPHRFRSVFEAAKAKGYRTTAHAGEEGPSSYIVSALDDLGVERIDHGVRAEDDPALIRRLAQQSIGLTMCPLSNVALKVVDRLADHNILKLLRRGVRVSVNSDDPAYFGGYLTDNYRGLRDALSMTRAEAVQLAQFGFELSFADRHAVRRWVDEVAAFDRTWQDERTGA